MNIPGLFKMSHESSNSNAEMDTFFGFNSQTFTVPRAFRYGNASPFSDYEKLGYIGEGSFGIVYKVREKDKNEILAAKKLKIEEGLQEMPQNFLREITNLQLLRKHKNIINLIDVAVGESLESTYLIFEFCKYSLSRVLDDDAKTYIQHPQIKNIMYQLFNGLAFIHKHCILHRDINPANILFNEKGILKITDFGSSRKIANGDLTPNIGTQWYRAPEILFGSMNYSSAVDIWSAGCVFAEMLLGKTLFKGDTDFAIIDMIIDLLGSPTQREWPEHSKLPVFQDYDLRHQGFDRLKPTFISQSDGTFLLIREILIYNPSMRLSAEKCLEHAYFHEGPKACSCRILVNALYASEEI